MEYEIGQKVVWMHDIQFIRKYDILIIKDKGNFGFYLIKNIIDNNEWWYRIQEQDGTVNFSHISVLRQDKINKIKERICLKKVI